MKTKILLSFSAICLLISMGCKKPKSIPAGEKLSIVNRGVSVQHPLIIENIDKYPDNTVYISEERSGKYVLKIEDYDNTEVFFPSAAQPHIPRGQYICTIRTRGKNISLGYFKFKN